MNNFFMHFESVSSKLIKEVDISQVTLNTKHHSTFLLSLIELFVGCSICTTGVVVCGYLGTIIPISVASLLVSMSVIWLFLITIFSFTKIKINNIKIRKEKINLKYMQDEKDLVAKHRAERIKRTANKNAEESGKSEKHTQRAKVLTREEVSIDLENDRASKRDRPFPREDLDSTYKDSGTTNSSSDNCSSSGSSSYSSSSYSSGSCSSGSSDSGSFD